MTCVAIPTSMVDSSSNLAQDMASEMERIGNLRRWNLGDNFPGDLLPTEWLGNASLPFAPWSEANGADDTTKTSLTNLVTNFQKIKNWLRSNSRDCSKAPGGFTCFSQANYDDLLEDCDDIILLLNKVKENEIWSRLYGQTATPLGTENLVARFPLGVVFIPYRTIQEVNALKKELLVKAAYVRTRFVNIKKKAVDCKTGQGGQQPDSDPACEKIAEALVKIAELGGRLQKIELTLGVADFPVTVPTNVTKGKEIKRIENIPQFLRWLFVQTDALTGQFPVKIKIADTDPLKKGNQEKTIEIPNVAEGIAELVGLGVQLVRTGDVTLATALSTLTEAGGTKKLATKTYYTTIATADFLGYGSKTECIEVPYSYNPCKTSLSEALVPSKQKIPIERFDGHKKNPTLQKIVSELLTGAYVVRAVFGLGTDKNDVKGSIKKQLKEVAKGEKGDFDAWRRQVERGFGDTPGANPKTGLKPYGRDSKRRPNVKEIGVDKGK